ncbi:hypothetical protein HYC85_024245 [Camellia sinensis]|uniref:Uncharacterized protein n=1 Tax=Camellia sinensis TaxID=4442 RepID=A0A7J7G7L1_CAMSI|nr:hypothetical protein HYC85_024245 [Camellia sinensis]
MEPRREREKEVNSGVNDSKKKKKIEEICFDGRPKIWAGLFKKHGVRRRRDSCPGPIGVCHMSLE